MTDPVRPVAPREHELKVWPEFYKVLETGEKTFELRKDDRGFRAGDVLWLREWAPRIGVYTGREMRRRVSYLISGNWGLERDYVCMALAAAPVPCAASPADLWQPIETAPKDGTKILVYTVHGEIELTFWFTVETDRYDDVGDGLYRKREETVAEGWNGNCPTHWMPLPSPPRATGEGVRDEPLSIAEANARLRGEATVRPFQSCHCPAKHGEDCPLTIEECGARTDAQ